LVDEAESSDESDSEDEDGEMKDKLMTTLDDSHVKGKDGLSKRAAMFFDQEIFADIDDEAESEDGSDLEEDEGDDEGSDEEMRDADTAVDASDEEMADEAEEELAGSEDGFETEEEWEDDGIEIVKGSKDEHWDSTQEPTKNGKLGEFQYISFCVGCTNTPF
jgi:AdoMet-dependent rRNA methyltransferase SPB1